MFLDCIKCKKAVEPQVLLSTLKDRNITSETKAICPECMEPFNVSIYVLKTLISLKQIYTKPKAEAAFSFSCDKCTKCVPAKLSSDKAKALCGNCGELLNITNYAIKAMTMAGR